MSGDTGNNGQTDPSELIEATVTLTNPPVYIEGGLTTNVLFSDMPNTIRIITEDGNTSHLKVTTTYGTIKPTDLSKGMYSYYSKGKGTLVELVAEDTITHTLVAKNFELVDVPAPKAVIWAYRKAMPSNKAYTLNADQIKAQNAVILYHDQNIPVLCNARSYQLTRIDTKGNRSVSLNESDSGMFTEDTRAIVQAAQPGDVYIVENIQTKCSKQPISNIVYIIQ